MSRCSKFTGDEVRVRRWKIIMWAGAMLCCLAGSVRADEDLKTSDEYYKLRHAEGEELPH